MLRRTAVINCLAISRPLSLGSHAPGSSSTTTTISPLRCRAGDKLAEIDDMFHLFSDASAVRVVLDLAAAPGSFTQVAVRRMLDAQHDDDGVDPLAIAVDLQKMKPMSHSHTLRCNILDHARIRKEVHRILTAERHARRKLLNDQSSELFHAPQVVLHDGVSIVDGQSELSVTYAQTNMAMGSLKLATELFYQEARRRCLVTSEKHNVVVDEQHHRQQRNQWAFVTKLMPSVHFNHVLSQARRYFNVVDIIRPNACREDSQERYLVCKDFLVSGEKKLEKQSIKSNAARQRGFSLSPRLDDVGGTHSGRQVMWHCFGCGRSQLGAKACSHCNYSQAPRR
ncbi:Hypothetical protein, putative [Bodo saltans]|uniref:Ribosomal RNA methyltransferase FtsJ domain-containing protein n=1 Tax=Bodo saltans TaxID=75058 RepID=A0A0S4IYL1_BODSA|nr:Hypothetical protein, putative [Bodo saltans]|eukprot:CUG12964.1 Hypothetical protein, putative [Bodo saltans]